MTVEIVTIGTVHSRFRRVENMIQPGGAGDEVGEVVEAFSDEISRKRSDDRFM